MLAFDARLQAGVARGETKDMNREEKAAVIDEVAGQIASAEAIFAIDYRGITVAQAAELRSKLRDADAKLRVVKNSLSERAADQAGVGQLKPLLTGPTALALVQGDIAAAAKALNDTARALRLLEFKGGVMGDTVLSPDDVRSIARLPSRDVLNAQLVGTIASPLSGLVRTLNALIAGLAVQLQAIADQGLVSGSGAPSAPEAELEPAPEGETSPEPAEADGAEAAVEPEAAAEAPAEAEVAPEPEPEAAAEETEPEQPEADVASDDEPSDD
jgi:large subunit ribosomal protein L10